MAKFSGKLSPSQLGWDKLAIGNAVKDMKPSEAILLGRIVGIASALHFATNTTTGELTTGLKGQFKGVSTLDDKGNVVGLDKGFNVTAGVCYIPGGLQAMIEGTLAEAQAKDEKAVVRFGIDIYAQPAKNPVGYGFFGETILDAGEVKNPLDEMLEQAHNALLTDETKTDSKDDKK